MKPFTLPRWRFTNCCGHHWGHPAKPAAAEGTTRREFLKTAAVTAAGLTALASEVKSAAAQGRVFPPPPPSVSPIEGLIDFHTHCAPDAFGRAVDDDESAQAYMARKAEAVVLKNHVALTADRAWLVRKHVPGIKVVGADGKALPAVRDVLKVCAQQKLVVCTGHASPTEALAIIEAARDAGCDRIVVTHAEFEVVNMSVEQMKKAASMGAKLEIDALGVLMGPQAHLPFMRHWRHVSYKESAGHIKEIGAQNFVLGTDLGQTGNPSQPDGYAMLVSGLMAEGIGREQIITMGREVPGKLLMG
ncbi:MAG: hypothetical protein AUH18_06985 [Candidatus Rokubacteria bacterium 13_2_20CM_69_10]|nr:MAG: hypothetical protein AUH18_06985 [Candidatus Rokubacteria bacterium 13_2_20CM_69_10]